jgi:hypothetical protein
MQVISNSSIVLTPSITSIVDELGSIDSEIKRLTKQAESLKALVKDSGAGKYAGSIYEALVFESKGRITIDYKAVAEHFSPSRQLLTAHTTEAAPIVSLKLSKV